ncbi:MAG: hypothetical protein IH852_16150 [Bacteroidetes bacterium]|nr:hypothetical protein [Bacteroidota bacterium]
MNNFAIACMSGSLKGIFCQGVLTAFEEAAIKADAYASSSSSTVPTSYAAFGEIRNQNKSSWADSDDILRQPGKSMSNVILDGLEMFSGKVIDRIRSGDISRLMIVCSYVNNDAAANETQSSSAVTLGRKLIVQGVKNISEWKDQNLELHVFDTKSNNKELILTADNYREVAYATTRMLHTWHIPATINYKPYIDGSYTCLIPIEPLADRGYQNIIAIATEPDEVTKDFFSGVPIGSKWNNSNIYWIKPEINLKELGVDFTKASKEGVEKVCEYGIEKGEEFINNNF